MSASFLAGQAEEPDQVRIRAEPAVPYSDRILGGQPRRHQGMRDACHREGGDRQRLGVSSRAERAHARDRGQAAPHRGREAALVRGYRRPADLAERVHGRVQGDSADHVG